MKNIEITNEFEGFFNALKTSVYADTFNCKSYTDWYRWGNSLFDIEYYKKPICDPMNNYFQEGGDIEDVNEQSCVASELINALYVVLPKNVFYECKESEVDADDKTYFEDLKFFFYMLSNNNELSSLINRIELKKISA